MIEEETIKFVDSEIEVMRQQGYPEAYLADVKIMAIELLEKMRTTQ